MGRELAAVVVAVLVLAAVAFAEVDIVAHAMNATGWRLVGLAGGGLAMAAGAVLPAWAAAELVLRRRRRP